MNSWKVLICVPLLLVIGCMESSTNVSEDATLLGDTVSRPPSDTYSDVEAGTDHGGLADANLPGDTMSRVDTAKDADSNDGKTDLGSADVETPTDTNPTDTLGLTPIGTGVFLLDVDSEALNLASATARFVDFEPLPEIPEETFPCTVGMVDPDAESAVEFGYDTGKVAVTGLLKEVTLTPNAEAGTGTGYTSSLGDDLEDLLPAGGALMTISAEGGADIAAWSGVLQAPEPVTIAKPSMGFGASHSVAKDLEVQWNPGTGTTVVVSISPLTPLFQAKKGNVVTCWFTDADGTGFIPAGVIAQVLDGQFSQNAALGVTRIKTDSTENDTHTIPLTAARASGGLLSLKP